MITWASVSALDAKLVDPTVPVAAQDAILSIVDQLVSPDSFGSKRDIALTFLAAHFGVTYARGGGVGATGIVLSASLGGASVSYANPLTMQAGLLGDLGSSLWGQRFQMLLDGLVTAMVI